MALSPLRGLKRSAYNILIALTGRRTLAYNSMSGNFAVWEAAEEAIYRLCGGDAGAEQARELAGNDRYLGEIVGNLKKGRFVVPAHVDEKARFERAVRLLRRQDRQMTLTIAPTLNCNFACDYCYQDDATRNSTMSPEVERDIIRYVDGKIGGLDRLGVAWYGGEPLLRPEIVFRLSKELAALCRDHGVVYNASMVTNGYLLHPDLMEPLIAASIAQVQVTLDGDRRVHDARRFLRGGGATFSAIMDNLTRAAAYSKMRLQVRVNIDRRNRESAPDLLDALVGAGLAGRENFSVYFAPVDICSNECLRVADSVMDAAEYAAVESRLLRLAAERGLAAASMPLRLFGLCAAVRENGFVILPDGAVHKCWNDISDPEAAICRLDDLPGAAANERCRPWLDNSLFSLPECASCEILANCSGGCFHKAKMGFASPCISLKHNVRDRLIEFALSKRAIVPEDLCVVPDS